MPNERRKIDRTNVDETDIKMAKQWAMLDVCAARTSATGVEEVLVVWKPTWEPVELVNAGAVWDNWVLEQAAEKAKFNTAARSLIKVASRAVAAKDDSDSESEDDSDSDADAAAKLSELEEKQKLEKKQPAVSMPLLPEPTKRSVGRPEVQKNVVPITAPKADAAKEVVLAPMKRGRGRPPKAARTQCWDKSQVLN